jgi:hypothetical protein
MQKHVMLNHGIQIFFSIVRFFRICFSNNFFISDIFDPGRDAQADGRTAR